MLKDLEEEIGEHTVRQFEAMGYIENAPSRKGDTWRISKRAYRMARLKYGRMSLIEHITDRYFFNVRKVSISLE